MVRKVLICWIPDAVCQSSSYFDLAAHFFIGLDESVLVVHHDAKVVFVFEVKAKGDSDSLILFA